MNIIILAVIPILTGMVFASFWGVCNLQKRVEKLERRLK